MKLGKTAMNDKIDNGGVTTAQYVCGGASCTTGATALLELSPHSPRQGFLLDKNIPVTVARFSASESCTA
jgi:hypothetical protein